MPGVSITGTRVPRDRISTFPTAQPRIFAPSQRHTIAAAPRVPWSLSWTLSITDCTPFVSDTSASASTATCAACAAPGPCPSASMTAMRVWSPSCRMTTASPFTLSPTFGTQM
jgi:hypothetical protein